MGTRIPAAVLIGGDYLVPLIPTAVPKETGKSPILFTTATQSGTTEDVSSFRRLTICRAVASDSLPVHNKDGTFLPASFQGLRFQHSGSAASLLRTVQDGSRPRYKEQTEAPMIVATWNVNSLSVRLPHLVDWLKANKPNIICIQETKLVDEKFPKDTFEQLGYHCEFTGEKTYNGVAVISDRPTNKVLKQLVDSDDTARRFLEVRIDSISILNVYIPNGQSVGSTKYEYKLRWLECLEAHLLQCHTNDEPLILCGDFNIAPEDRDIYQPEAATGSIMVSDAERIALDRIRQWGLTDTFRLHDQEPNQFSWWDYRMGAFRRNLGFRIDHLWVTQPLARCCTRAWIDKGPRRLDRPSDHAPVIAQFDL